MIDIHIEGFEYAEIYLDSNYYATFNIGENCVHVEQFGTESERETVKDDLVETILKLIENGEFDFSQIQE